MKIKDVFFMVLFVMLGVLTRTVFHVAPNVEFVTALSLAAGYFIRKRYSFAVPLGIMIISDVLIGNSAIYLFTWSAYAVAWLIGQLLTRFNFENVNLPKFVRIGLKSEIAGILFTAFFFLWTNFGVVVVTSMYTKNISGVVNSYIMGIPFLVPQLVGNMIIVPSIFILAEFAYNSKLQLLSGFDLSKRQS